MLFRIAENSDLPQLEEVYTKIYLKMREAGVDLWNKNYPYNALPEDINLNRLWVLCDNEIIAAAFAIDKCPYLDGITWTEDAPAAILMRLGVNPEYHGQGIGRLCLEYAGRLAAKNGMKYLRMLVVDKNTPAAQFYIKTGGIKAGGKRTEYLDSIPGTLVEYGYELICGG